MHTSKVVLTLRDWNLGGWYFSARTPQGTSNAHRVATLAGLTTPSEQHQVQNGSALDRLMPSCYNLS
jgi:hypothetical protein